jgi:uncharacterized protein
VDPSWWAVAIAGLFVGFVVGLTGMGGGALMTPMMILLFGVQPLAAVSSDLVASMVMKPVGGAVHLRKGTVNREMVRWLVTGSVPSAFAGVLLLRLVGDEERTQTVVKTTLGVALLVATIAPARPSRPRSRTSGFAGSRRCSSASLAAWSSA